MEITFGQLRPSRKAKTAQPIRDGARSGLWRLLFFLLVSVAALYFWDFDLFASLPEGMRLFLGCPPPAELIGVALAVYSLSSLVLILSATVKGSRPKGGWFQMHFRIVFYFLYLASGALEENFLAVLIAGLGLTLAEQYHLWSYSRKETGEPQKQLS